jgi:hypothetical protein
MRGGWLSFPESVDYTMSTHEWRHERTQMNKKKGQLKNVICSCMLFACSLATRLRRRIRSASDGTEFACVSS